MKTFLSLILFALAAAGIAFVYSTRDMAGEEVSELTRRQPVNPYVFGSHGKTKGDYIAYLKRTEKDGNELNRRIRAVQELPVWP